jgi:hypothetical protein
MLASAVTLDIYSHVTPTLQHEAAGTFDALFMPSATDDQRASRLAQTSI